MDITFLFPIKNDYFQVFYKNEASFTFFWNVWVETSAPGQLLLLRKSSDNRSFDRIGPLAGLPLFLLLLFIEVVRSICQSVPGGVLRRVIGGAVPAVRLVLLPDRRGEFRSVPSDDPDHAPGLVVLHRLRSRGVPRDGSIFFNRRLSMTVSLATRRLKHR